LQPEHLAFPLEGLGGSDANIILSGDAERITRLWREKRREELPEDLSFKLPVMLGSWTESCNRQWYEQASGYLVEQAGVTVTCGERS
jgi:hypothetical protein